MLPPQLTQARGLRPGLRSLTVTSPGKLTAVPQVCAYSWWHKQRDWLSPSDPEHERLMHRRKVVTKGKLRRSLQRQDMWEKPTQMETPHWTRRASSSNKPWKGFFEELDDSHKSTLSRRQLKKQRLEQLRQKFDAKFAEEPYQTMFGKRFEPFWNRLMPDFVKQEMEWQTPVVSDADSNSAASKPAASSFSRSKSFQLRSSHKAGSKPSISAWSSSWDSASNQTRRSFYDPISGRMVDQGADATESVESAQSSSNHPSPSHDTLDSLTASDIRGSMGKTNKSVAEDLATRAQQLATLEEDYKNKTFDSEHEELLEARKTLEALRTQVQILERRAHASTLTKPEDGQDEERPAFFEDGWNEAPQGMQTAFATEKEADGSCEKTSLEQEMAALDTTPVQEINDGYEPLPTGMQTQYELENSSDGTTQSLEQEMAALNKEQVVATNDGYSTAPIGMETLYEKEDAGTLEQELAENQKREEHDDGYSTTPTGMQTAYDKEDVGTLEQELNDRLKRKEYDDGYSTAKTGMQGMYEKEGEGALEKELNENLKRKEHDDGYSKSPIGMQTLYKNEDAGVLEKELNDKLKQIEHDDGYSTTPSGMQTAYQKEHSGDLEQELNAKLEHAEHDDGYSTTPSGMQTAYAKEDSDHLEQELNAKLEREVYEDGYATKPVGLETAFNTERQHSTSGKGQSLEQEMTSKPTDPPSDGGYATMPIGLQVLFKQEQLEAEANKRGSLEDELKIVRNSAAQSILDTEIQTQKNHMQDHEDGYTRNPIGMQSSFEREEKLKALQGEGDICTNVGKFCNSRRWYKQSASNNLSEQIQKAQQRASDRHLVREVRDIYENNYGPITTEHHQPQSLVQPQGAVGEKVQPAPGVKAFDEEISQHQAKSENAAASSERPVDSSINATTTSTIKWAEPAIYKVVAYDVHKEAISITTTPSSFSNTDSPISISNALSRLHQPARFIPHFAELQKEGYQVINASRDWLVLRKVDQGEKDTSVTNEGYANPVDLKMKRPIPYEELPTGRFASPTGFVNHDPIFPPEPIQPGPSETVTVEIPVHGGPDIDRYRHRRVRREEPIFSGSKRWRERRRDGSERKSQSRFRDRMTWALSVGAGTAVCMYIGGVVSELAKAESKSEKKN